MTTNENYIYLDLDETLFHTEVRAKASTNAKRINFKLGTWWYCSLMRPSALDLIAYCRDLSLTRVLTNSTRDYATIACDLFGFDFSYEELVCRDDYIRYEMDGWGGYGGSARETAVVSDSLNRHGSILVDNLYPDDPGAIQKRQFLGIDASRYIQIREFRGEDPECFKEELHDIKTKIAVLVHGQSL